jgi:hypothetical protein
MKTHGIREWINSLAARSQHTMSTAIIAWQTFSTPLDGSQSPSESASNDSAHASKPPRLRANDARSRIVLREFLRNRGVEINIGERETTLSTQALCDLTSDLLEHHGVLHMLQDLAETSIAHLRSLESAMGYVDNVIMDPYHASERSSRMHAPVLHEVPGSTIDKDHAS